MIKTVLRALAPSFDFLLWLFVRECFSLVAGFMRLLSFIISRGWYAERFLIHVKLVLDFRSGKE